VTSAGLAAAARAATRTPAVTDSVGVSIECRSGLVRMFGTSAGVAYRPNQAEIVRRQVSRLGSLTELDVLDGLLGLPVGLPVALCELTGTERAFVERVPAGAVELHGGRVVRRAVAPVSVQFAVVAAQNWRVGLKRAGQFAPFCARAMLLPARPGDWTDAQAQASYYGVGVCMIVDARLRMIVEPRPYVRSRHTPAQWWFAEEAYRQISECESAEELAWLAKARRTAQPRP
jgi:hypothetical protein